MLEEHKCRSEKFEMPPTIRIVPSTIRSFLTKIQFRRFWRKSDLDGFTFSHPIDCALQNFTILGTAGKGKDKQVMIGITTIKREGGL